MTESVDLRSVVHATRRTVDKLSGLRASMEARVADYEQVGGHPERLEQRGEDGSLRRERDDLARSLPPLRAAHEALLKQPEGKRQTGQRLKVIDNAPSELRMIESILRSAGHDVLIQKLAG